jgi:4-alpha-glucanotransferase
MLPVVPPGKGSSPYDGASAFAGSPWLVSLEVLAREGLLAASDPGSGALGDAARAREPGLRRAFERWHRRGGARRAGFDGFRASHRRWLRDFALFSALKAAHGGTAWTDWDDEVRRRRPAALARARRRLADEILYHEFVQFQFDRQWSDLRRHCRRRGVGLFGDLPIFVAHDSADVWAHPEIFRLDAGGRPAVVAGIPPDYFTRTGQLWGNPLYRWDVLRRRGYDWWLARLRSTFARFDAVRIDHFVGFHRFWEVPGGAATAERGRWAPGPGAAFLEAVFRRLGPVQLLAEDLGVVTPEVKALRDRFGLPGMRVLQFAFGDDPEAEAYQPHNYPAHCVVYTGTHDNDTTAGWFRDAGSGASTRSKAQIRRERALALRYLASDGSEIHWDMIRLAWMSVADTALAPAQDLLGLGSAARMNRPGIAPGNWGWRLRPRQLGPAVADRLAELTVTYGRAPRDRREGA